MCILSTAGLATLDASHNELGGCQPHIELLAAWAGSLQRMDLSHNRLQGLPPAGFALRPERTACK
jgi:hypothetical protein